MIPRLDGPHGPEPAAHSTRISVCLFCDDLSAAIDDEHHFWTFATHVKDVDLGTLTPPA